MLLKIARAAQPFSAWISCCALLSEASGNFTQDRQTRAKIFRVCARGFRLHISRVLFVFLGLAKKSSLKVRVMRRNRQHARRVRYAEKISARSNSPVLRCRRSRLPRAAVGARFFRLPELSVRERPPASIAPSPVCLLRALPSLRHRECRP